MPEKKVKQIRVSSKSPVAKLAGSIIISIEEGYEVELRAVGASAVNQMVKAIATARGTIATKGRDLLSRNGFDEVVEQVDDEDKTKTVIIATLVVM